MLPKLPKTSSTSPAHRYFLLSTNTHPHLPVKVLPVVFHRPRIIAQQRPVSNQPQWTSASPHRRLSYCLPHKDSCSGAHPRGSLPGSHDCRSCFTPGEDVWLRLFSRHGPSPHSREVYCTAFHSLPGLALLYRHHPVVCEIMYIPFVSTVPAGECQALRGYFDAPRNSSHLTTDYSPGNGCHGNHSGSIEEGPHSLPRMFSILSQDAHLRLLRMEQKDDYRQTSASKMVSIARENTCDNSNMDLWNLVIKPLWTHRTWISSRGARGHPRFQSGHMDFSHWTPVLDLLPSLSAGPRSIRSGSYSRGLIGLFTVLRIPRRFHIWQHFWLWILSTIRTPRRRCRSPQNFPGFPAVVRLHPDQACLRFDFCLFFRFSRTIAPGQHPWNCASTRSCMISGAAGLDSIYGDLRVSTAQAWLLTPRTSHAWTLHAGRFS